MTHLDSELRILKSDILEMWRLVVGQLEKGKEALTNFDRDLAEEVVENEKRVNSYELKIDKDCENIFALFQPVATDLRLVLASLKISNNLERVGDIAASVADFVLDAQQDFNKEILERTKILEMYGIANEMLADTLEAFDSEDTRLARTMFKRDKMLDKIDDEALDLVYDCIKAYPEQARNTLLVMSMIRKLERVGDMSKNIAEEIIFYFEAKVLKHKKKKQKEGDE
ncbi:MAG: phosphate signaling complex protein PhoU [Saprospiraceae bacterium]|jgi:phosphate transport system protein|nr:phosphate signaling complex protein PhoU [Saprospiraceae bacterium]